MENVLEDAVKAVKGEAKKVEEAVVAKVEEVKAAIVSLTGDEKFLLRDIELEYLKAQMEIQRLSKITESKSKDYQTAVDGLLKKYLLDKAEYIFDGTKLAFNKIEKAL